MKNGEASGTSFTDIGGVAGDLYRVMVVDRVGLLLPMSEAFALAGGGGDESKAVNR